MINQQIRAFFLFFLASVIIFSKAYSDESKHPTATKEYNGIGKTSLISKSSNSILDKKNVEENFLEKINVNGIGLISIERTKFPSDLWRNSSEKVLSEKLISMPNLTLSSTNKIFKRLLLVDAKPPLNSIGVKNMGYLFLLSRIDQLINLGAIDEVEEILNYIKDPSVELMKRKIQVASLNGRLSKTCDLANKYPNFEGMLQFKIICLVRKNDWQAAALAFTVGSSLKQFDEKEKKLLLNYLDPDIETDSHYDIEIKDLSPTSFYLMHGKKELVPPDILPNKYAYAFSLLGIPPKIRIKSMEQLASKYVVNANTLFGLYRSSLIEDKENSNDAKIVVMQLEQAFNSDSEHRKLLALKQATKVFQKKKLLVQLSNEYVYELKNLYYSDDKRLRDLAIALLSLTDGMTNELFILESSNPDINCLIDIKKKVFIKHETDSGLCELVKKLNIEVIKKSFPASRNLDAQMEKGLILLESLNLLENGLSTEFEEVRLSLSMLTKIGLIDLVNEISVELIALNSLKKLVRNR